MGNTQILVSFTQFLILQLPSLLPYTDVEFDFCRLKRWIQDSLIHPTLSALLAFSGFTSSISYLSASFPGQTDCTAQQKR